MNNQLIKIWNGKGIVLKKIGFGLSFIVLAIVSYAIYDGVIKAPFIATSNEYSDEDYDCSIMGINLHGTLWTYIPPQSEDDVFIDKDIVASEDINYLIKQANEDDAIEAILIEVDSLGGLPVAGEEVANSLKNSEKPTVAVIRQSGLSAAYWAVTGADYIFASKNSDVGSIGVTASYLQNVGKNQKDGSDYVQLSSGKYKDAGDPDRPLTEEERQIFLRDIKIVHQNFIADVSTNRNIPLTEVEIISDGSSVLGERAKELHLIDDIGGLREAEIYLENLTDSKSEVCWY
ncbi:MAG: S49 family peptidase [Patescibacteria group bacterium]